MTKPTLPEMSRKVYEAMANTIQTLNALTPYLVDQNGLPTIDVRTVLEKTLGDSLMTDIKALDEQGVMNV